MGLKRLSRVSCICSRALPFSSTLLFLSLILPSTSYAQITNPASSATYTPTLTTLLTISSPQPSATDAPPPSLNPIPTQTDSSPPPGTTTPSSGQLVSDHVFNYYFLIIAFVAILCCILFLYIGNRKKRKAAFRRTAGQRALARDVEGFRTRWGMAMGRNNGFPGGHGPSRDRSEREDGLDERGEAPPPYVPGSKPPSVRSTDGVHNGVEGEAVELRPVTAGTASAPPEYDEHRRTDAAQQDGDLGDLSLTRPAPVATSERFGSMRRLLNSSNGNLSQG